VRLLALFGQPEIQEQTTNQVFEGPKFGFRFHQSSPDALVTNPAADKAWQPRHMLVAGNSMAYS